MNDRLDKLKKQMAKLQGLISAEEKRLKEIEAKELRQKVELIGQFVYDRAVKDGSLDRLVSEMDAAGCLTKASDRKLFGIETPLERALESASAK